MLITMRRLFLSDLSFLQTLGRATYEPYYQHLWFEGGVEWYLHRCFNTGILQQELQNDRIEYYAAETETGRLVGMLKWVHGQLPPPSVAPQPIFEQALYLEKIYLMPEFFGKGVGQILLEMVAEKAREMGKEALWLQVMHSGPLQAYEKAGFMKVGESRFEFDLLRPSERGAWVMLKML